MDTEALEMEDFAEQVNSNLKLCFFYDIKIINFTHITQQHLKQLTTHAANIHTSAATTPTSAQKILSKTAVAPPTIAVTPSLSIEAHEERPVSSSSTSSHTRSSGRSRPFTPPTQADVHRSADEPSPSSVRKGSIEP